jgi:hypothetical protein
MSRSYRPPWRVVGLKEETCRLTANFQQAQSYGIIISEFLIAEVTFKIKSDFRKLYPSWLTRTIQVYIVFIFSFSGWAY